MRGQRGSMRVAIMAKIANDIGKGFLQSGDFRGNKEVGKNGEFGSLIGQSVIKKSSDIQVKVDRLQMIVVAKNISTCRNCSSVGCLKCVQFHNWFRLH